MTRRMASLAVLVALLLLTILTLKQNIKPVKAEPGCVTIKVQYLDGCPRSGADVVKIDPPPTTGLGTAGDACM